MAVMAMLMLFMGPTVRGFRAYDCNNSTGTVEYYSLLEPGPCIETHQQERPIVRSVTGEIVQLKKERLIQVTRCQVIETMVSQYCGFRSRVGVTRYHKFREPYDISAAVCRTAAKDKTITTEKKVYPVKMGTTTSHTQFITGSLDDSHTCQVGVVDYGGKVLGDQTAQAIFEVTIREEWARVNDVTGMITMASSGIIAPVKDQTVMDSAEGTYVWQHTEQACPDSIVQLYYGEVKVLTGLPEDGPETFVGGLVIVEGRNKDQVAGLEITENLVMCGRAGVRTHIKNIIVFFSPNGRNGSGIWQV